jgi:hypothetical protein
VLSEALGTDYAAAKNRCDTVLNPHYRSWLTKGEDSAEEGKAPARGTFDWMVATYKVFRQQASRLGLADDVTAIAADRSLEAREQINSGKWTPEPVQPDETSQILADIRRFRQQ